MNTDPRVRALRALVRRGGPFPPGFTLDREDAEAVVAELNAAGSAPVATDVQIRSVVDPDDADPALPPIDEARCALDGAAIGWLLTGAADEYTVFRSYVSVQAAGDEAPTRFCEDCYSWLELVAPVVVACTALPSP